MLKGYDLFRREDGQSGVDMNGSSLCRDLRSSDIDSTAGEVLYADVVLRNENERHVSIDTPEEGKIG